MNYIVSARQPYNVRKKAQELLLEYVDIDGFYDLVKDHPNAKYVVRIRRSDEENLDLEKLKAMAAQATIVLSLDNVYNTGIYQDFNYFWTFQATTWFEVRSLVRLGVSELVVGGALMFDLNELTKFDLPLRAIVNNCAPNGLPVTIGCQGPFVRPEDIKYYEKFLITCIFDTLDLEREAALLDIYLKQSWPGNLNLIISNLNLDVDNRGLPQDFGSMRAVCGQKCMRTSNCHLCENAMWFSRIVDKSKSPNE